MKHVLWQGKNAGFTIVEVLIVLGISAAILLSAIILVGGRQNQTEFTQAINNVQSQIQDTINDVINGYYPASSSFQCGSIIKNNGQGTNGSSSNGCTFVGKAMQFGVVSSSPAEEFETYTVAGQESDVTNLPTTYTGANINIPVDSGTAILDSSDILENGLTTSFMTYCPNGVSGVCDDGSHNIRVVAFLSRLTPSSGCGDNCVAGQQLYLAPVKIPALANDSLVTVAVADMNGGNPPISPTPLATAADSFLPPNQPQSVNICFASGTTSDSGLITITNGDGQLAVNLKVHQGNTTCS